MTHLHDHDRPRRLGMPEAVLCDGKLDEHLIEIIDDLVAAGSPTLLTRLPAARVAALGLARVPGFVHDPVSSTAVLHGACEPRPGRVAVVAAGTSDESVAAEAAATLRFTGVACELIVDVGVAALWRLLDRVDEIREADVVIVVAGMDAALASVMGGLVSAPVIGVPTSVGYGVAEGGTTALHSMLASCAQGVTVVNIDNGFGGACAAIRMLSLLGDVAASAGAVAGSGASAEAGASDEACAASEVADAGSGASAGAVAGSGASDEAGGPCAGAVARPGASAEAGAGGQGEASAGARSGASAGAGVGSGASAEAGGEFGGSAEVSGASAGAGTGDPREASVGGASAGAVAGFGFSASAGAVARPGDEA